MLSKAALLLLLGTTASGLTDVEISNIDKVDPPSFETTSCSISFNMNCDDVSCFSRVGSTVGTFDRAAFMTALMTAAGDVGVEVNAAAGNPVANAWTVSAPTWDRVVESTGPFNPSMVEMVDGTSVVDGNYWNVFIRFTFAEMPVEVAESASLIVAKLSATYPGINFNSMWISTDAVFITEQLEPVKGRGHKDRKLLIPLVMGIFCMLTIPMLVSWMLVKLAESHNKADATVQQKSKVISEQQNLLAGKNSALSTYEANEEKRAEEEANATEMRSMRIAKELNEEDVDWEAQKVVNQPFGN